VVAEMIGRMKIRRRLGAKELSFYTVTEALQYIWNTEVQPCDSRWIFK
jgi:hypothetical protein